MLRYATYKAVQKQPGGHQLVAFTRILHRTKPDILYNEVLPSLPLSMTSVLSVIHVKHCSCALHCFMAIIAVVQGLHRCLHA